jgi:hypothetical protein
MAGFRNRELSILAPSFAPFHYVTEAGGIELKATRSPIGMSQLGPRPVLHDMETSGIIDGGGLRPPQTLPAKRQRQRAPLGIVERNPLLWLFPNGCGKIPRRRGESRGIHRRRSNL